MRPGAGGREREKRGEEVQSVELVREGGEGERERKRRGEDSSQRRSRVWS